MKTIRVISAEETKVVSDARDFLDTVRAAVFSDLYAGLMLPPAEPHSAVEVALREFKRPTAEIIAERQREYYALVGPYMRNLANYMATLPIAFRVVDEE